MTCSGKEKKIELSLASSNKSIVNPDVSEIEYTEFKIRKTISDLVTAKLLVFRKFVNNYFFYICP